MLTDVLLPGFFFAHKVGKGTACRVVADAQSSVRTYEIIRQVFFPSAETFARAFGYGESVSSVLAPAAGRRTGEATEAMTA